MDIYQSLFGFMDGYSEEAGDVALAYRGKHISRRRFYSEIDRIAAALQAEGIKKGDSVALCLPNVPEAAIAFYAINKAGAIVNAIHPKTHPLKLRAILETTQTKLIFAYAPLFLKLKEAFSGIKVVLCGELQWALSIFPNTTPFYRLKGQKPSPVSVGGEDIAVYIHSGGTMGVPKTVMLPNRAINALVKNMLGTVGKIYSSKHAMLAVLPIFHAFGMAVTYHAALSTRAKLVMVPVFKAKKMYPLIKRERVTAIAGIPRMFEKMLRAKNFKGEGLASLEDIYCGGDYMRPALKDEFEKRMRDGGAFARFCQGYGLSETASVCVLNLDNTPLSIGKPLDGVEIKITDENGKPAKKGLLWVSSEQCMSGYLGDAEATAASLKTEDGKLWLSTGDLVETDERGNLFFCDRAKRLIKISGINVFPSEIERTVNELPTVVESCAVEKRIDGKPYLVLFVVLAGSDENAEKLIVTYLKSKLNRWFIPSRVVILGSLPLTKLGKTDVKLLERLADNVSI